MKSIALQIHEASYWEHFKCAKDLALYLPLDDPKRVAVEKSLNEIAKTITELKK